MDINNGLAITTKSRISSLIFQQPSFANRIGPTLIFFGNSDFLFSIGEHLLSKRTPSLNAFNKTCQTQYF